MWWWLLLVTLATATTSKRAPSAQEPVIEEVTAKQLERVLQEKDYVAVFWCKYLPTEMISKCASVVLSVGSVRDREDAISQFGALSVLLDADADGDCPAQPLAFILC